MSQRPAGDATVEINADNSGLKAGMAEAEDLLRRYAQAVTSVGRAVGGVQPYGLIENVDGKIRRAAEAYELLAEARQRSMPSKNAGGFSYGDGYGLSERTRQMIDRRGYGSSGDLGLGNNLFKQVTGAAALTAGIAAAGAAANSLADAFDRVSRGEAFGRAEVEVGNFARSVLGAIPIVGAFLVALERVGEVAGQGLFGVSFAQEDKIANHVDAAKRLQAAIADIQNEVGKLEATRLFGADSSQARAFDNEKRIASLRESLRAAGADENTVAAQVAALNEELQKTERSRAADKIAEAKSVLADLSQSYREFGSMSDARANQVARDAQKIRDAFKAAGMAQQGMIEASRFEDLAKYAEQGRRDTEATAKYEEERKRRLDEISDRIKKIAEDEKDAGLSAIDRQLRALERLGATQDQIDAARAGLANADAINEAESKRLQNLKEIESTLDGLRRDSTGLSPSDSLAQKLLGLGASADIVGEAIRLQQSIRARGIAEDILNRPATSAGTFSAISASMMGIGRVDLVTINRTVSSIDAAVQSIERRIQFLEGNEFA